MANNSEQDKQPPAGSAHSAGDSYHLEVSSYDKAASLLIALLVLVGAAVLGIVIVYFASRVFQSFLPSEILPTKIAGRGDAAMGFEEDIEPPGAEEAAELEQPDILETLTILSDTASKIANIDEAAVSGSNVATKGTGQGDHRRAGPRGDGISERVPREERWKINYTNSRGLDAYAAQLGFFGIEPAAYDANTKMVHYASNVAKPKPDTRRGLAKEDERLYMFYQGGPLAQLDSQLLQRAGVNVNRKRIIQFYPLLVEGQLEELERQYMIKKAGKYDVDKINRTTFGVNQQGDSYQFFVLSQVRI